MAVEWLTKLGLKVILTLNTVLMEGLRRITAQADGCAVSVADKSRVFGVLC